VPPGEVGGATEAGHGRRQDLAAELGEALQRPLVGVLAESPAVEEQHGDALARDPVHSGVATYGGAFPEEVVLVAAACHRKQKPRTPCSVLTRSGAIAPGRVPSAPPSEDLLALELVQAAPDAVGLTDPDGVVQALPPHGTGGADALGPRFAGLLFVLPLKLR